MTQLIFRYSKIYDRLLAHLARESFGDNQEREGFTFTEKIAKHWEPLNEKVFLYYKQFGFTLPEFWLAYPVHQWRTLIPFDDPLTIFIKDDLDDVVATLVHEICHVFFGYYENSKLCNELWEYIVKTFPNEDRTTQEHLPVILLAQAGLCHLFGAEKADALLMREKRYEGLERAWQIIDSQKGSLSGNPVESVLHLTTS